MLKKVYSQTKECIPGNYFMAFGIMALYMFLGTVLMASSAGSQSLFIGLSYLLLFPLAHGLVYYFYNVTKKKQKIEDLLAFYIDFKTGLKLILALAWYLIITAVGFVLFIIPGIIWSYRYVMYMYEIFENKDISIEDAFKNSAEMMKGYKFKYFLMPFYYIILPFILFTFGLVVITINVQDAARKPMAILNEIATLNYEETAYYSVYGTGNDEVMISFGDIKQNTYSVEETEDKIVLTVDKTANDFEKDKVVEKELKDFDENVEVSEPVEVEVVEKEMTDVPAEVQENKVMLAIGGLTFGIGIVWLIGITPYTLIAQPMFYRVLKDQDKSKSKAKKAEKETK